VRASPIILLVAWAAPVWAQLPAATEGRGIKVGEGMVLHPGLSADMAYDSNVLYDAPSENPIGSPFVLITGHFDLASLPPQRLGNDAHPALDFRLNASAGYREYLSSDRAVEKQRAVDVDSGFHATFNPEGAAYLKLFDQFVRQRQPRDSNPLFFTQDRNRAGAELGIRPGGGMVTATLGYELNVDLFEENPNPRTGNPDSFWHMFSGGGRWKFLPKTALTLDVAYAIYNRDNSVLPTTGEPAYEDSTALRTTVGVTGLITPKVTAVAKLGYGRANYDAGEDFGSVIAALQLNWRPTLVSKLALGYDRDFQDSVNANFYVDDYVYASYEHLVGGRWLFTVKPGVRARRYESNRPQFTPSDPLERSDTIGELQAGLSFQVLSWFLVGAAYNLQTDSTGATIADQDPSFTRHVVLFRAEAAF
jgi:hypothetical protein